MADRIDAKQIVTWTIAAVALVTGGLGGAVLTVWYTNRATVIEYTVTKTVIGRDQATVVPDLELKVGQASLRSLCTYTVRFRHVGGPEIENAKVGFDRRPGAKIIAQPVLSGPSRVHEFQCQPFSTDPKSAGALCMVRRLGGSVGAYSIAFATEENTEVSFAVDGKNVELRRADVPEAVRTPHAFAGDTLSLIQYCVILMLFALNARLLTRLRSSERAAEDQ